MTEDIFDMSDARILKKLRRKNRGGGGVYSLSCLWSAELSKVLAKGTYAIPKYLGYRIAVI